MEQITRGVVDGKLFLYEKPEMLAREDHMGLGLTPIETPFAHTKDYKAIPITLTEFRTAQKHYPIIFTELENPIPLAVVGVVEEKNLFLDANGKWDELTYVPAYLRCYPFAFAHHGEDQMAVVIDRAAAVISDQPKYPFFDGEEISEHTKQMSDFAARYVGERRRTEQFCKLLVELNLLTGQSVTQGDAQDGNNEVLANYVAIDAEALAVLDDAKVAELHKEGLLSAMYAHIHSLENWTHLITRRRLGL